MFVNWFHNTFYYILDVYKIDVHIIKAVCIIAIFELFDCFNIIGVFFCEEWYLNIFMFSLFFFILTF